MSVPRPNAVVVGGCGFIGSRLALSLARSGFAVTVADVAAAPPDLDGSCHVRRCDVAQPESLRGVFAGADVVYLAAAKLAKPCDESPERCWSVNVAGTVHTLAEIIAGGRRPRVVFLSTGTVYAGRSETYPTPEDAATEARDLYVASKLAGEHAVAAAAATGALSAVVLRLFTVYGPGPAEGRRGHFVAGWMERAALGLSLTIASHGEQTVDLTHVIDVVQACQLAASAPIPNGASRVYNIGSGTETRVRDVARWMREVVPSVTSESIFPRPSSLARQFADIARARAELGYRPVVAPEDGIKSLLREHLDRAQRATVHGGKARAP